MASVTLLLSPSAVSRTAAFRIAGFLVVAFLVAHSCMIDFVIPAFVGFATIALALGAGALADITIPSGGAILILRMTKTMRVIEPRLTI